MHGGTGWRDPVREKPSDHTALKLLCYKNLKENRIEEKSRIFQGVENFFFWLEKYKGKVKKKRKDFFELVWLHMPVYRVIFRLKFPTLSGHMIKCLLTGWEGWTGNIWFSVISYGPRCSRSVRQYFPFPVWLSLFVNKYLIYPCGHVIFYLTYKHLWKTKPVNLCCERRDLSCNHRNC